MSDTPDITFVKRIVLGSRDAENQRGEEEIVRSLDLLNRCLRETPKGRIIGIDRSFSIVSIHGHHVVLECVAYHVGFPRVPAWLND